MDNYTFAERLKDLRADAGWIQMELAEKLYINRATLAGYETGRRIPHAFILCAIADVFCVSVDYLLGHEIPAK